MQQECHDKSFENEQNFFGQNNYYLGQVTKKVTVTTITNFGGGRQNEQNELDTVGL